MRLAASGELLFGRKDVATTGEDDHYDYHY